MTTEQPTPPAVVLSTAQLDRFEEAVGSYWDCAYQEGHLNRPDGDKANAILHEIRCAVQAMVEAEREACAKLVEEFPHWLGNTGRSEIATALRLRHNAGAVR